MNAADYIDKLKTERAAYRLALKDLLEDNQHAGHECGDTPENCPVLRARETLARYEKPAHVAT